MSVGANFAQLLASRICHDLISPVGAVVNGADLVREILPGDVREEMSLITQSAARASALLQFYRIAFGTSDDDAMLSRPILRCQADNMLRTDRVILEWQGMDGPALTRGESRLFYLLLLCGRAILGMRGRVAVALAADASFPVSLSIWPRALAAGTEPVVNTDLLRLLETAPDPEAIVPRTIEFALLQEAARALRVHMRVAKEDQNVRIDAVQS